MLNIHLSNMCLSYIECIASPSSCTTLRQKVGSHCLNVFMLSVIWRKFLLSLIQHVVLIGSKGYVSRGKGIRENVKILVC